MPSGYMQLMDVCIYKERQHDMHACHLRGPHRLRGSDGTLYYKSCMMGGTESDRSSKTSFARHKRGLLTRRSEHLSQGPALHGKDSNARVYEITRSQDRILQVPLHNYGFGILWVLPVELWSEH